MLSLIYVRMNKFQNQLLAAPYQFLHTANIFGILFLSLIVLCESCETVEVEHI